MAEEELPSPVQVLEAVKMLSTQYEQAAEANREMAQEFARRKKEFRWIALGVLLVVVGFSVAAFLVRHQDRRIEADRRSRLAAQIFTQRESSVQGCERANEQRATLRRVIIESYEPGPPIAVPPGLEALIAESAARSLAKRDRLLTDPGVQIVDCQAAYPLPVIEK